MNPELHAEHSDLKPRDSLRGTGRTKGIIHRLIDHVVSVQRDKPAEERNGILVINHPQQWEYIVTLAQSMSGYIRADNRKRIVYFSRTAIHVIDRFHCDQFLRGLRWPIALDHTVWEDEKPIPEILYVRHADIINFN